MSGTLQGRLDQRKVGSILVTSIWLLILPFLLAFTLLSPYIQPLVATVMQEQPQPLVLGLPLVAIGVAEVGLLSFGPQAFGVISFGGAEVISFGGIGIVSFGGGTLGVLAIGGAACGLMAVGGAALGCVTVGGGGLGVYVLAGAGKGRYVFDRRRQDAEAVEFFCKVRCALENGVHGLTKTDAVDLAGMLAFRRTTSCEPARHMNWGIRRRQKWRTSSLTKGA